MPWGDGTGPAGWGPMTGRAAGYCAGYAVPGFMNSVPRGGFGVPYAAPYAAGYGVLPYGSYAGELGYAPRGFYGAYPGFDWGFGRGGGWGRGRGRGRGFGRGRGRGWGFAPYAW